MADLSTGNGTAVARVLIQGAGIGGLALAIALARRGVQVDVIEGAGRAAVFGVGLNQPANALAVLDTLGVRDACLAAGFPFEDLVFWNPAGDVVAAIPPPAGRYGRPSNNAIGRPAYFDILTEAAIAAGARVETGRTVVEIEDSADGVDVEIGTWKGRHEEPERTPGGDRRRYDLRECGGRRSRVRTI